MQERKVGEEDGEDGNCLTFDLDKDFRKKYDEDLFNFLLKSSFRKEKNVKWKQKQELMMKKKMMMKKKAERYRIASRKRKKKSPCSRCVDPVEIVVLLSLILT